ncbi:MAG: tetratricopeptide repeat protein [Chloroflexi bacterium]|nr:tetratricopeptide repeat protein [Chloroflexota bacterium]
MNPIVKRVIILGAVLVAGVAVVNGLAGGSGLPPADRAAATAVAAAAPVQPTAQQPVGPPEWVQQAQQRLAENPRDTSTMAAIADWLYKGRRFAQAADLYYQAVDVEPDNAHFRVGLGLALFYQGMPNMAQRELKRAIELNPKSTDAHFNYALMMSHGSQADLTAARASWEKVVQLDGDGELGRKAREFLAQTGGAGESQAAPSAAQASAGGR